jgi:hypothetical protein
MCYPVDQSQWPEIKSYSHSKWGGTCYWKWHHHQSPHGGVHWWFLKERMLCGQRQDVYHRAEVLAEPQRVRNSTVTCTLGAQSACHWEVNCWRKKGSLYFFFFLVVLGFELRAYTLSHSTSPFLWCFFFEIGSAWADFELWSSWFSATWVARITGVSHQYWAKDSHFDLNKRVPLQGTDSSRL